MNHATHEHAIYLASLAPSDDFFRPKSTAVKNVPRSFLDQSEICTNSSDLVEMPQSVHGAIANPLPPTVVTVSQYIICLPLTASGVDTNRKILVHRRTTSSTFLTRSMNSAKQNQRHEQHGTKHAPGVANIEISIDQPRAPAKKQPGHQH